MALIICIFILGMMAFVIWVYQAIILPSIRQELRFKLFRQRDELRELVIAGKLKEDSAVFRGLHQRLNVSISAIPVFDFAFVSTLETSDPKLRERSQRFQDLMGQSIPEAQQIFHDALVVMTRALIFNSLFWFTWLLIAAIPLAISQGIWKLCSLAAERAKGYVLPAFELRPKDLDESFFPTSLKGRGLTAVRS